MRKSNKRLVFIGGLLLLLMSCLFVGCQKAEEKKDKDVSVEKVEEPKANTSENKNEVEKEEVKEESKENVDAEEVVEEALWAVYGLVEADGQPHVTPMANEVTGKRLNVIDYGAVANDPEADNVDAIMAAIDAAEPGDEVYLPEGVYWLKKASLFSKAHIAHLELKEGVNFTGDGYDKSILMSNFPDRDNESGRTTVMLIKGQNNIVVSNIAITSNTPDEALPDPEDQNKTTLVPTSPVNGIAVESDSPMKQYGNVVIENVLIEKFQRMGVRISKVRDVRLKSSIIQKATDLGKGGAGYAVAIQGGKNGIDITDTNIDTLHNIVEDCEFIGPYLRHGVIIQYHAHNNLIRNNRITGTLLDSIDLHGEDEYNNEIVGNVVENSRKGAGVGVGNSGATHDAAGPNNYIHDNEIVECSRGIDVLYGTAGTIIENNHIYDIEKDGATGILLRDAHDTLIKGNTIENISGLGAKGIAVYYAYDALEPVNGIPDNIQIVGNTLSNMVDGIYVETHSENYTYEDNAFSEVSGIEYDNQQSNFVTPEVSDVVIPKEGDLWYPTDDNFITNEMRTSTQTQANMKFKTSYFDVPYNRMIYVKFDLFESPLGDGNVYLKFTSKSKDGLMTFNIYGSTEYTDWLESEITWENAPYHEDTVAKVSDPNGELTLITDFTYPAAGDVFNTYYVNITDYVKSLDQNTFTLIMANDLAQDMYCEIYSKDISQQDYKMALVFEK